MLVFSSQETFFVLLLSSDIEDLVEWSFQLTYYAGIQPSEVDRLSTYEFNKYIKLIKDRVEENREYEVTMAQNYGAMSFLRKGG